jgi:uncharacterized protein YigE (DUF2233 family)
MPHSPPIKAVRAAALLVCLAWLATLPAAARAACRDLAHEGRDFTLCEAVAGDDLRLFQTAPDGAPYGTFERINKVLAAEGATLGFAMNAGMYHPDRAPVGLMIENGTERARIVTSDGPGNFGLLPNGVFCIAEGRFLIAESRRFQVEPPACRFATQSGPLLVIDGALHPRFIPDSPSRYIRNGVGVSADGRLAYFLISQDRVNFAEFARVFRDALGTPQALFFDGNVSRL